MSDGLSWGTVILAFLGAVLSAYSSASILPDFAAMMGTWGGISKVPIKIVLEQKAYSTGALLAILFAFVAQALSMLKIRGENGQDVVMLSVLVALAIFAYAFWQRGRLVLPYQRKSARLRNLQGQLADMISAQSDTEDVVHMLGIFYDCRRMRNESLGQYRDRLAARIADLAR